MPPKQEQITFVLREDQARYLRALAMDQERSVSFLVRDAVRRVYFPEMAEKEEAPMA